MSTTKESSTSARPFFRMLIHVLTTSLASGRADERQPHEDKTSIHNTKSIDRTVARGCCCCSAPLKPTYKRAGPPSVTMGSKGARVMGNGISPRPLRARVELREGEERERWGRVLRMRMCDVRESERRPRDEKPAAII